MDSNATQKNEVGKWHHPRGMRSEKQHTPRRREKAAPPRRSRQHHPEKAASFPLSPSSPPPSSLPPTLHWAGVALSLSSLSSGGAFSSSSFACDAAFLFGCGDVLVPWVVLIAISALVAAFSLSCFWVVLLPSSSLMFCPQ